MSARDFADLTHPRHGKPVHWWRYNERFAVARFVKEGEGRTFDLPAISNGSACFWHVPSGTLPLYGTAALRTRPDAPVLVVQNEAAADAARDLFPDHVCITWPGGPGAVNQADTVPLMGRHIILWRDNDMASLSAMTRLKVRLNGGARSIAYTNLPPTWPTSWHLACPLPDGVTREMLQQMLLEVGRLQDKPVLQTLGARHSVARHEAPETKTRDGVARPQRVENRLCDQPAPDPYDAWLEPDLPELQSARDDAPPPTPIAAADELPGTRHSNGAPARRAGSCSDVDRDPTLRAPRASEAVPEAQDKPMLQTPGVRPTVARHEPPEVKTRDGAARSQRVESRLGDQPTSLPNHDWPEPDLSVLHCTHDDDLPPFPPDVLPPAWRDWTERTAGSVETPIDYVALSLLTTTAGLIGGARFVSPTPQWREPCVLWTALVGGPSSGRTRGMDAVLRLARALEHELGSTGEAAARRHATVKEVARVHARLWRTDVRNMVINGAEPDEMPAAAMEPPLPRRLVIEDPRASRVAEALRGNTHGILLAPDALAGWLRQRGGADRRRWLRSWSADAWTITRARQVPLDVPCAAVSILGTLAPQALRSNDDGDMVARFLFAAPQRRPLSPRTAHPQQDSSTGALDALTRLRDLPAAARDMTLSRDAQRAFDAFRRAHDDERDRLDGQCGAWWDRGLAMVLRLAGVLAFLDWATHAADTVEPAQMPGWAMDVAVRLWRDYLWPHARAVLGASNDHDRRRHIGRLLAWLRTRRPHDVSREQIRREALSQSVDADGADAIAAVLVDAGWLRVISCDRSGPGRPRSRWQVNPLLLSLSSEGEGAPKGRKGDFRSDSIDQGNIDVGATSPFRRVTAAATNFSNFRYPFSCARCGSLLPGEAGGEEIDAVVRQTERFRRVHQGGADAGLQGGVAGVGHDHAVGLGPGLAQLIGRHRRTDHVVAALHDGAGQVADAVEVLPGPALGQEDAVDEVVRFDARQRQREAAALGIERPLGARIQRRARRLVAAPGAGGRLVPGRIGVDKPTVVVGQDVAAFGQRQVPDEIAPSLGKDDLHAMQEPLHFAVAPEEDAAQDEAQAAIGMALAIRQGECRSPGPTEYQPPLHTQMLAQPLDLLDQGGRGVVGDITQRQRAAGAALIEDDDAVERWIEEAPVDRRRTGARPAMQEHHRHAVGIAALLPVERVPAIDGQHAAGVRNDVREQFRP